MFMKRFSALLLTMLPFVTMAHPGHGDDDGFTIKHYFIQPEHVLFTLAVLALVAFLLVRRSASGSSEEQND
jgi:hypothetical protein